MTNFRNRYASAVRSKNLRSDGGDQTSDADVIGAAGLAGRAVRTVQGYAGMMQVGFP
jgi:hypothetical protein